MRRASFLVAFLAAGTASAQMPVRDRKPIQAVALQPVDADREQRIRSLAIRLGQVQLDALIDEIIAEDLPLRKATRQLASR